MTPESQKFKSTVRRLEIFAKASPRLYLFVVALLSALGYLYIFIILGVLLGTLVGMIVGVIWVIASAHYVMYAAGKFLIILFLAIAGSIKVIFKALTIRIHRPEGPELTRQNAPRLFAALDQISRTLKAPKFHRVLLDSDFNAGVVQVPRFGIFGFPMNYLMIGLPLMKGLSPDQFRAVIGHELGHISGNHSRFGGWIYRQRAAWFTLLTELNGNILFVPFFNWYAPYFFAYTFVLARANEYVADRCGAEVAGAQVAGEALIVAEVNGRFLMEKFWPEVMRQADLTAQPSVRPFGTMLAAGSLAPDAAQIHRWYREAWHQKTDVDDTHPSLADRLAAMGFRGSLGGPLDAPLLPLPDPKPLAESAAERFLGPLAEQYSNLLDTKWRKAITPSWQANYNEAQQDRGKLEMFETRSNLSPEESLELAQLTARFHGKARAIPILLSYVQSRPQDARGHLYLGLSRLAEDEPAGIRDIEQAVKLDNGLGERAYKTIASFLSSKGEFATAETYSREADRRR